MSELNNPYKSLRIEFHILQSFPVTCLNRDDVGAPKTAIVGGSTRARVSSQCWKRQVRMELRNLGFKLGIRSKHINDLVKEQCKALGADEEKAQACGEAIMTCFSKDTLHFFTESEAKALAEYAQEKEFDHEKIKDKEAFKLSKKVINPALDGLDIALFGRMVAQSNDLNIEAAASFSHAISTHKVSNEVEFFTALDDYNLEHEVLGSGHMGSLEFNSATYYRYICLDLGQLWNNLNGTGLEQAVDAFTKALFLAIPAARQTTQSGASCWEFAKIMVRKGQRLQVPFETAIKPKEGGFLQNSIDCLSEYLRKKEKLAGSLFGKQAEFTFGTDENYSIDNLVDDLKSIVTTVENADAA